MLIRHCGLWLLTLVVALGVGCSSDGGVRKYIESREVMGTLATITLIAADDELAVTAMDSAFAYLDEVNARMNPYAEESEIFAVNAGAHEHAVTVSEMTYHVLAEAGRYSKLSGGAFDATVGPLLRLWKDCAQADRLPTEEELSAARARCGAAHVRLDPAVRSVRFDLVGMRVDLGGIAKGFAIDGAANAARSVGIRAGIVEVGGDLTCFGEIPRGLVGRPAREPVRRNTGSGSAAFGGLLRSDAVSADALIAWPLGVQSPFADELLGKIRVPAGAVATSGHYQRYVTIAGRRYSHIVDPRTGRPVASPASVTVLAPEALSADALATAITVLGAEAGLAHAESLANVEALIVTGEATAPQMLTTSGFPKITALE